MLSRDHHSPQRPFLSIIIPAYNEEERLPHTFHEILSFVQDHGFTTEVLIVNNASTDRSKEIITDFLHKYSFFQHIYEPRRGKGAAVRTGVLSAQGEYILICDADMATPIEEATKFLFPPNLTILMSLLALERLLVPIVMVNHCIGILWVGYSISSFSG